MAEEPTMVAMPHTSLLVQGKQGSPHPHRIGFLLRDPPTGGWPAPQHPPGQPSTPSQGLRYMPGPALSIGMPGGGFGAGHAHDG